MTTFIFFCIGVVVGACIGVLITGLLLANGRDK